MKKSKKIRDERIEKASNKLSAYMYIYMLITLMVLFAIKLVKGISPERYIIEILCFTISCIYMIISLSKYSIKLFTKYDDELKEIKTKILSKCGMICFWIIILGEFVLLFPGYLQTIDILFYALIWGIPALCITFYSIKHGLLIWGGTKRKASGKNDLAIRTSIGAIFYGILMGGSKLYSAGTFHASGFIWIIGLALGWGLPFYFIFNLFVNQGEKNADRQVKEAEREAGIIHEKQANENSQDRK
ncbi:hypothetical protein GCM10023142_19500 [Anaerocolumna aminovalerica]|uniref:Uncharacterized protein n=2 Tax=Anaerocolumna aminovalerica TaxID=1527 RepID=A0A1I5FMK9_9FIRM|nr:DUF6773 family protein [Anaerocolumna aminovalerica]SFO25000.1 hypothetical protein SAMN04489757_1155 [Anaerocolumna aminovalerica]